MSSQTANASPIRIMIVDDAAAVRGSLNNILSNEMDITVVAAAADGQEAVDITKKLPIDIILLDIKMPKMDGITALPLLQQAAPNAKIIMLSILTKKQAEISLLALEMGASDYIEKPTSTPDAMATFSTQLLEKIRTLAAVHRKTTHTHALPVFAHKPMPGTGTEPIITHPIGVPIMLKKVKYPFTPKVLAIGCSTGGPQALVTVFKNLTHGLAHIPIFITQHMPPTFTTMLAEHIKQVSGKPCIEPKDGEKVLPGNIYLSPGDFHMEAKKVDDEVFIHLSKDPPENFCRPSVNPMLRSLAAIYGKQMLTLIMTGMGQDGLEGCIEVTNAGGVVIAQDEQTSVVWGMPGAVATKGLCSAVLPLDAIASHILDLCKNLSG